MENATKALLIAAAILVAILIISLALVVYNMASETVNGINLSQAEITQFNDQFQKYEGTSVSGSQVNAMLKTVFNHNLAESNTAKKVSVSGDATLAADATSCPSVDTGNRYSVTCVINSSTGLVSSITVTKK